MSTASCRDVERQLAEHGLLVLQAKGVRSVASIITGEELATSWWSHARAHEIFACSSRLGDSEDVLTSRLIAGKVTFVHRTLWPAFLALACSGAPWQTRGLSEKARALLRKINETGSVQATGAAAKELQERLLVSADEVHTETGRHAIVLQQWHHGRPMSDLDAAREKIEAAAVAIGATAAMLPWQRFGATRRPSASR